MEREKLVNSIVDACYKVHLALVPGYLESVYSNALMVELQSRGLECQSEVPLKVWYKGRIVGDFRADIVVENSVIIELKAVSCLTVQHEVQIVNYLTCTGFETGILVNFGSAKLELTRKYRTFKRRTEEPEE